MSKVIFGIMSAVFVIGAVVFINQSKTTSVSLPSSTQTATVASASDTQLTYTIDEVRAHNSRTSCWSVVDGSVYDLTSMINRHPGGAGAILSICGSDGSRAFSAQHGMDRRALSELSQLKMGQLSS